MKSLGSSPGLADKKQAFKRMFLIGLSQLNLEFTCIELNSISVKNMFKNMLKLCSYLDSPHPGAVSPLVRSNSLEGYKSPKQFRKFTKRYCFREFTI